MGETNRATKVRKGRQDDEVLTSRIFEERHLSIFLRQIGRFEAVFILESLVDLWLRQVALLSGAVGRGVEDEPDDENEGQEPFPRVRHL